MGCQCQQRNKTEFRPNADQHPEEATKEKKITEKEKLAKELDDIILNNIKQKVATMLHSNKSYSGYLKKVQDKKMDPFEAADKISSGIVK